MAVALNKNSFCCIHRLPPFYIKTNLRENRFFATRDERLVDRKGTFSVKFLTEKITVVGELTSGQVNKKTSGGVNELIALFSFLEKYVFSPRQC